MDVRRLTLLLVAGMTVMAAMGILSVMLRPGNAWFDLDAEVHLAWPPQSTTIAFPAAWSGALLVGASLAWGAAWRVWDERRIRPWVLVLSLFFLFMASDELFGTHEKLEKLTGIDWQVLYVLPVLLMAGATLVVILRLWTFDRMAFGLLLAGCVAWGLSQVLELVQWNGDVKVPAYVFLMVPEELGEATGSALFLLAGVVLVKALLGATAGVP